MSQKFTKLQNNNKKSTAYGKWFATAVYDQRFVETEELANYIQQQASVKKSDIKAVLDELGGAMKHYFELGQKVKLDGIGIFKVGFSSIGAADKVDCTAATITTRRVFEETYDPSLKPEGNSDSSDDTGDENTQGGGSGSGDNTQGGNQGGSTIPGEGD